jgi:hypothetical protein
MTAIRSHLESYWLGWTGETVAKLIDGSEWAQIDNYVEYRETEMPRVTIENGFMSVEGMSRGVRVQRIS